MFVVKLANFGFVQYPADNRLLVESHSLLQEFSLCLQYLCTMQAYTHLPGGGCCPAKYCSSFISFKQFFLDPDSSMIITWKMSRFHALLTFAYSRCEIVSHQQVSYIADQRYEQYGRRSKCAAILLACYLLCGDILSATFCARPLVCDIIEGNSKS